MIKSECGGRNIRLVFGNALKFCFNVLFAYFFQVVFGTENILPGVAVCIGLTTLPEMDLGIRGLHMSAVIWLLYMGAGLTAQMALGNIWAAFFVNFAFVAGILLLSAEPVAMKTSISFLLCFVFCQANPVPAEKLGMRLAALAVGSLMVSAAVLIQWRRRGILSNGRKITEQICLCGRRRGYILRTALGLATAMAIGMAVHLERPMWISIVVMSLSQIEFAETKERILYRSMATILGAAVFYGILVRFIPGRYAMVFILLLGYLSFFTTKYKYTQIVNAVCALNASLFLLDPQNAIVMRIFCLAIGITVTLAMWKLQHLVRQQIPLLRARLERFIGTADADIHC